MKQKLHIIKVILIICFLGTFGEGISQSLLYQQNFKGEVFAVSKNLSAGSIEKDTLIFEVNMSNGVVVVDAILLLGCYGYGIDASIEFNGNSSILNNSNRLTFHSSLYGDSSGLEFVRVKNDLNFGNQNQYLIVKNESSLINRYNDFLLVVLVEDLSASNTNLAININNNNFESYYPSKQWNVSNLNKINPFFDVGFSVFCGYICDNLNDGASISINNNLLGVIGGSETGLYCDGPNLAFSYSQGLLNGINDDSNDASMLNTDMLSNAGSFFNLNDIDYNLDIIANSSTQNLTNSYWATILSYTTPCDTFTVNVPSELNTCRGDTATIQVTGGNNYEWTPQVGLSCYNCPNPIVTADSNMYYSLRVWNTDSCSKVLPIRINVLELPEISNITTWDTPCTDSIGHFLVSDNIYPFATYTLNDTLDQFYNHFYFLPPGEHDLIVSDTNNCKVDTVITINSYNDVVASFTANPILGDIPFDVDFTNTSTAATDYIWYVEDDTLTATDINHIFTQEGSFDVTLVAIDQYLACSDTASIRIIAETPFSIFAPTIVNQSNGIYSITISGSTSLEYMLYDDLGQLLFHQNYATTTVGLLPLWSMNKVSKGVYFYTINATNEEGVSKVFSGKVVVM